MASLELRPSRRGFLAALAGVGGALACRRTGPRPIQGEIVGGAHRRGHLVREDPRPATGAPERRDVAILGAGITGLSAAWALERAGLDDFVVLELEDDAGGTARSGSGPVSPYPWAAHYVPAPGAQNRPLVALLEEMGVVTGRDPAGRPSFAEEVLVREPQERLFFRGEWFEGLYPVVGASPRDLRQIEELEQEMARWARWRDDDGRRAFAVPRARGSSHPEVDRLDTLSMTQWLDEHGWDSPRLRWYVEYACRDDFGSTLEQTSAWAGVHYFAARAGDEVGDAGQFLTWPEGNGRLVDHLASAVGDRLRLGALATDLSPGRDGIRVAYLEAATGRVRVIEARHVVFALPRFLARYLVQPYRDSAPHHLGATVYGSWMVANLTLRDRPSGRGFEPAWDNVLYDSPSLGYVTATHQTGADHGPTVLTYYLPLLEDDPVRSRTQLLETSWEQWAAFAIDDLSRAHPDLESLVERLDVYLWGHAMVRPRPGFMCGRDLADSALPLGRIHFAHTDLSGMALFEEAQYWGIRAAEEVMRAPPPLRELAVTPAPRPGPWIVSARWDVAMFGGSAALALGLLVTGRLTGILDGVTPPWAWVATILLVDVAHVWSTAYRVYLDPGELRRRTGLYAAIPLAAYVLGVLLYSASSGLFWRVLAYVAVLHFVRQQYGWVALYRRRLGSSSRLDQTIDDLAIYSATLYPLLYWHAHLPREFEWFIEGDFIPGLPASAATVMAPIHWAITATYFGRQVYLRLRGRPVSDGKDLVVATTWLAWYGGIVWFDSDYAFTVTNVLIHGIPYLGLVWVYGQRRWEGTRERIARLFQPKLWPLYLAPLVLAAWSEEWLWDRLVWHERAALFPGPELFPGGHALALIVPLLALPQATHYVLDAWIWKVKENPGVGRYLGF